MAASVFIGATGSGCAFAPSERDYAADNMKVVLSPECPDVSGVYEGRVRQIVEGFGPGVLPFTDEVFHPENVEAAEALRRRYHRDVNGRRIAPDTTSFQKLPDGNYVVTVKFGASEQGSFRTRFNSRVKVSCEAGTIGWVTPEQSSRSDFGPNYSFSGRSVKLDKNGDILLTTWTHMSYHMALFWLPMGSGTEETVYRYKRVGAANEH